MSAAVHELPQKGSSRPASATLPAIACVGVAVVCAAAGSTIARAYPIWPVVAIALFVGWCVVAALRTPLALAGLFALMPVVAFAPRTGWLIFEEFDLMVLATAAGGYAALALRASTADAAAARDRFAPHLTILSLMLVGCYVASDLVSLQRGIASAGGFRFGWSDGYNDPLNSVRVFKGLAWAMLLLPLLTHEVASPRGLNRIGTGVTIGLGLACLVVVKERVAFTGLLDFSQDYRATGPFWEMHVGGATLDAFLVLTIPFAIRETLRARRIEHVVGAACVLALALYATFVTFSRGLYLAVPVGLALLAILLGNAARKRGRTGIGAAALKSTLLAIGVGVGSVFVFRAGGYRALLATFAVFVLGLRVAAWMRHAKAATWCAAAIAALALGAAGFALATVLPKGPYVVFSLACAACVAALFVPGPTFGRLRPLAAISTWLWAAIAAWSVATGWGGRGAGIDSATVLAVLVGIVAITSRAKGSPWPEGARAQLGAAGLALFVTSTVAVMMAGTYMGGRVSSGRGDLQVRIDHWVEGIGRLRTTDDWLFGMGIGRFPGTSMLANTIQSAPGSYRVVHRDGETFLTLAAPRLRYLGFGELFRFSQVVSVRPKKPYVLSVESRGETDAGLSVEVCEKHLIYSANCASVGVPVSAANGQWTTRIATIDMPDFAMDGLVSGRPIVFAMAVDRPGLAVDIRAVHLFGPDGVDVLANSQFARGTERWFSSSDMNHSPFHIFNFPLGVLFDQGLVGLVLLVLLIAGALLRTILGRAHRHPDAPYIAAGLVAFLVLGAVDDPIEAPRIGFVFHAVLLLGLMLRNPRVVTAAVPNGVPKDIRPSAPGDGSERSRRRANAFR